MAVSNFYYVCKDGSWGSRTHSQRLEGYLTPTPAPPPLLRYDLLHCMLPPTWHIGETKATIWNAVPGTILMMLPDGLRPREEQGCARSCTDKTVKSCPVIDTTSPGKPPVEPSTCGPVDRNSARLFFHNMLSPRAMAAISLRNPSMEPLYTAYYTGVSCRQHPGSRKYVNGAPLLPNNYCSAIDLRMVAMVSVRRVVSIVHNSQVQVCDI